MATFGESFGLFDDHVGHLDVTVGRLVECRCDDFCVDAALHIGDLLGSFVDKQDDHIDLGVVVGDGIGYLLEQYGLTCFWRCDDECALTFADRCKHVDDAA